MSDFINNYVDNVLATAEGKEDHESKEGGAYTSAYGVTERIREAYPKKKNESPRDYAVRVSKIFADEAESIVGTDAWEALPDSVKLVALDVHYNSNLRNNPTFKRLLQEGTDLPAALKATLDIISANDPKAGNVKATMPGLANRRAAIYNIAAKDLGIPTIKSISVTKNKNGGINTNYLTEQGNSVFDINTSRLHTSSDTGLFTPNEYTMFNQPEKQQPMQDPIEQAGVRTVQPEQQEEDGGLFSTLRSLLGF